mmetsp:Transcript_30857/g.95283  ORF Transcript_30857/g.95283 Transcript_30857/m.95283 type:complete len:289 (-) Transcript_30857:298-1164(-)
MYTAPGTGRRCTATVTSGCSDVLRLPRLATMKSGRFTPVSTSDRCTVRWKRPMNSSVRLVTCAIDGVGAFVTLPGRGVSPKFTLPLESRRWLPCGTTTCPTPYLAAAVSSALISSNEHGVATASATVSGAREAADGGELDSSLESRSGVAVRRGRECDGARPLALVVAGASARRIFGTAGGARLATGCWAAGCGRALRGSAASAGSLTWAAMRGDGGFAFAASFAAAAAACSASSALAAASLSRRRRRDTMVSTWSSWRNVFATAKSAPEKAGTHTHTDSAVRVPRWV